MSIIGIGTDIVQLARIQRALEKHGERFARRILHRNELARYRHHSQPVAYLAKRFAAKEAVAKALGTGIGKHAWLTEIETGNNQQGKPVLQLYHRTRQYARELGIRQHFISLADEREYAIAYVILTS